MNKRSGVRRTGPSASAPRVGRAAQALTACSLLALLCGAPAFAQGSGKARNLEDEGAVRRRADSLIAQMTPEEEAGQLSQYFDFQKFSPAMGKLVADKIPSGGVGSLLFITDPNEINRLQHIAVESSRLKIPLLFGFDVIHGLRTIFPVPIAMASSWDTEMVEQAQSVAASEARAVGVHWAFAPMIDIARDPRWGRIVEGAGEDPYLGSAMAAAQVRGFQGSYIGAPGHIIAGPKHFAGYGAVLGGRDYDEVNLADSELWNVYFPPFKAAVEAGAGNIMSAYMSLNGVPAAGNRWLLTKVLRDQWGFKGFVVSDSGAGSSLVTQGFASDKEDAGIRALKAGLDMEMTPPGSNPVMQSLPAALKAGKITKAELDDAVRRVLEVKIRMGLFENPYVDADRADRVLNDPAHWELAKTAAERSVVLLRNEASLLPLSRQSVKSIAVIGPLADSARDTLGPWVFQDNKPTAVSVLKGLRAKLGSTVRIDYSEGVRLPARTFPSPFATLEKLPVLPPIDETAEIQRAVTFAKNSDVAILVLGEGQDMIGESASRSSLDLPGRQQELLDAVVATGKPVVVLLMSARPINLKDTAAQAIMDIWYPGSAGGEAVADLLFGDAIPGGKLPFTWIRDAAQAPNPYAHLISHAPADADKRYWNGSSSPTYPFGFGLSYTTFAFANLKTSQSSYLPGQPVPLSVEVTNTGKRSGDEVVQVYIHQKSGTSSRPVRELKAFRRVALRAGETKTIRFTLSAADLSYWSSATNGWVSDESRFDVWAGGDSAAKLATSFEVSSGGNPGAPGAVSTRADKKELAMSH